MSLADKWKEYRHNELAKIAHGKSKRTVDDVNDDERAFYAGAEAWRDASENGALTAELNAEIDHFRSHK